MNLLVRISLLFNRNLGPERSIADRFALSCGTTTTVGFAVISAGSILVIRRSFTAPIESLVGVDTSWIDSSLCCEYDDVITIGGLLASELIRDVELAVVAVDKLEALEAFALIPLNPIVNDNWSIIWRGDEARLALDDDPRDDNDPVSPDNITKTGYSCM